MTEPAPDPIVSEGPASEKRFASAQIRDRFLTALDQHDDATLRYVAEYLMGCMNLLPSSTCTDLGLAPGSTYGDGERVIRQRLNKDAD